MLRSSTPVSTPTARQVFARNASELFEPLQSIPTQGCHDADYLAGPGGRHWLALAEDRSAHGSRVESTLLEFDTAQGRPGTAAARKHFKKGRTAARFAKASNTPLHRYVPAPGLPRIPTPLQRGQNRALIELTELCIVFDSVFHISQRSGRRPA